MQATLWQGSRRGLGTTVALAAALSLAFEAPAHQDPPGCLGIDNSMRLIVTRNNGDPVVGTVTECETIKYQAELEWDDECLIQGGTFKLVTPDGVEHEIANPVPCLGDATTDAEGCLEFQATAVLSPFIDYTVSPGDAVAGKLTATAVWENGFLHQATPNVPGQGDMRALVVDMMLCDEGTFCSGIQTCDPEATNGVQLGICVSGTPPDCGTSDECADRFCSDELEQCVVIDTSDRCGESDFCVERGCNPESGCFEIDNSETLCPDLFCTDQTCNPAGGCNMMDVSSKCIVDPNLPAVCQICDEELGQCIFDPNADPSCQPDNDLDHFQCYEVRPSPPFAPVGVQLVDQFTAPGGTSLTVRKPRAVCAPADKNDEDPAAPGDPDHLTAYSVSRPSPKFERVFNQEIVNQFGTTFVDVVRPTALLVPSGKSLVGPPASASAFLDHFTCYKVRRSRGTAKFQRVPGVKVEDQFFPPPTGALVDVIKPTMLCAPTNKNGENPGAEDHPDHLLCYKVRGGGGLKFLDVFINNQFGQQTYQLKQRRQFCVPSLKNPGGSPSGAFL